MTPEVLALYELLHPIRRRIGFAAALRWVARAACAAAGLLCVWALATAAVPIAFPLARMVPWMAAGLAGLGLAAARRCRPSPLVAARLADRRANLVDRLGTAIDLVERGGRPAPLARWQLRDALSAGRGIEPRRIAPVRFPREAWVALGLGLALAGWVRFGAGWAIPGTPAARVAATIHREGHTLVDLGRRLEEVGRGRQLPETLRAAPALRQAGRRLEAPRVGTDQALAQVRDVVRQLTAAQERVRRRIDRATSADRGGKPGAGSRIARIQAARRALQDLAGSLHEGNGTGMSASELARRLGALQDSFDQLRMPNGARAGLERAHRAAEQGHTSEAGRAMDNTVQDLRSLERMLGDEQELGQATRQAQRAANRIARAGRSPGGAQSAAQRPDRDATSPKAPGDNPVAEGGNDTTPPPPGPNQGSRPGRGTGGHLAAPAPRLAGKRTQSRLEGLPGAGTAHVREIAGPGQAAPAARAPGRPPADVSHEIDRALSRDPLPPAYLTLVRRYFDSLGGAP